MRRYHDSTGESELAMDEALELANRFLAQFPKAFTLDGFANQGLFIGLAIKSKRLVKALYCKRSDEKKATEVYRSGYASV